MKGFATNFSILYSIWKYFNCDGKKKVFTFTFWGKLVQIWIRTKSCLNISIWTCRKFFNLLFEFVEMNNNLLEVSCNKYWAILLSYICRMTQVAALIGKMYAEMQIVVDLPPNLKFMLSTFLILTRYIITGKQLDGVLWTIQKHVIWDLPISFLCMSASIGL